MINFTIYHFEKQSFLRSIFHFWPQKEQYRNMNQEHILHINKDKHLSII